MRVGGAETAGAHRQRVRARIDVAGHGRVRRAGSIGLRLLLPVAVASVGLVVAGMVQVKGSADLAREASRARVLADATASVVSLVDQIDQEIAETNTLRERGGTAGAQLLAAQRIRTDRALSTYLLASRAAVAERPGLTRAADHVTNLLTPFAKARTASPDPAPATGSDEYVVTGFGDAFEQITHHLLELGATIAEQLTDPQLANLGRSAYNVSALKHLANQQRDLLRTAFTRRELTRDQLVTLAELYGDEQARRSELTHIADERTRQRYLELAAGPDAEAAGALRDAVIRTAGGDATLKVDADTWYITQSAATRRLRTLELELTGELAQTASHSETAALTRAVITGVIAALVVLGTLTAGTVLAVRTTRRLRRLRNAALAVARTELPAAVAQVANSGTADRLRGALSVSHRRVGAMMDTGSDEVAEVSSAIGVVHQQALRLAAEQALLRQEVSALFVALSRRGQTLVQRQLQLIDGFELTGADPDTLNRMFALDHIAARMRRNEENLLVLAGGEPGRRFEQPVVLADLVRLAAAEIEEYSRVDPPIGPDVWVAAHAVGDVVHVLAELLDNATSFSPPDTRVGVVVERVAGAAAICVLDQGIGMSDERLVESNRRLARPGVLTSALVGTMGLLVVARLAARRALHVQLRRGPSGGTTADLLLPADVLTVAPAVPLLARVPAPRMPVPAVALVAATPVPVSVTAALAVATVAAVHPDRAVGPMVDPAVAAVPAEPVVERRTASGLPIRRPGASAEPVRPEQPPAATPVPNGTADFLDPEVVRARLASLAGGIAAAARRGEAPPGGSAMATPPTRPAAQVD
ncbi:MAG TPA: nitrate- and nitrite sensing domain-containing protein [Micromonosporaceae bacterium]|nr:nitrate- and nitrite sensing domain-containing protein [Micromonosporaceae bacterium]